MKIERVAVSALSAASILALWAVVAALFPPTLLPGPVVVLRRLAELIATGDFWLHLRATVQRVAVGFALAFVVSVAAGTLMGARRLAESVLSSWVLVGLTIPGLCWAVLAVMWFGITEAAPIFAIFVVVLPMLTLNIWQGTKSLDRDLIEMARVFRTPWPSVMRNVVLPQLLPFCLAGARLGFALGWKVVVLSEMLGLSNGVGYMINRSFSAYSMDDVLAWTVGFTLVMFAFEYAVMLPIERRLVRWRPVVEF
ncbi:MAG TPA: ABC transporter permease [Patescibacteria group bacterium]|nr:ABC transporter permease [Patescibacteria group bacterium]